MGFNARGCGGGACVFEEFSVREHVWVTHGVWVEAGSYAVPLQWGKGPRHWLRVINWKATEQFNGGDRT